MMVHATSIGRRFTCTSQVMCLIGAPRAWSQAEVHSARVQGYGGAAGGATAFVVVVLGLDVVAVDEMSAAPPATSWAYQVPAV